MDFAQLQTVIKNNVTVPTVRGNRNIIELFQLPLKGDYSLDSVSSDFLDRVETTKRRSLVEDNDSVSQLDELRLSILKYVIAEKKADEKAAKEASDAEIQKSARVQTLLARRARLQDDETNALSKEEVDAELAELGIK